MVKQIKNMLNYVRFQIRRKRPVRYPVTMDIEQDLAFMAISRQVDPYTGTSLERQYALFRAVEYVVSRKIPGDFVECGVLHGGSSMLIALALRHFGDESRRLFLFDTFAGMSQPTEHDQRLGGIHNGPMMKWKAEQKENHNAWCYCSLEEVQKNMSLTNYPDDRILFIKGKVEDTLPHNTPDSIALLRLDTDFYESTREEMTRLYPKLSPNGVLILDDYGLWLGSRKAVDDYFLQHPPAPLLVRIDKPGRLAIKL